MAVSGIVRKGLFAAVLSGLLFTGSAKCAARADVASLQLIDNNHVPKRIVVIHTSGTASFVKELFSIVKKINEEDNISAVDRLKLHIVPSSGNPISSLGISAADAEKYIEINPKYTSSDIWAQDCMEICAAYTAGSDKLVPAVFDTNRGRGLAGFPKALADFWGLAYTKNPSNESAHGDYGGNLEVTPFDNIMVSGNTITPACKAFFEKMGYAGRMFHPDTRWLTVGHIDEYLSFIPTSHVPGGYSIVKADPAYALDLLAAAADTDFAALDPSEAAFLKRVKGVLNAQRDNPNAAQGTPESDFIELNRKVGEIIDKSVGDLKNFVRKQTNDENRTFGEVSWPCFYEGRNGPRPSGCCAYLPGVVNLTVVGMHLLVPASHFPPFDRIIEARFRSQGNKVHFVDDRPYHNSMGEIHCGTNMLRDLERTVVTPARIQAVQRVKERFENIHELSRP
ncbi:MAG: protein-arginine deiminase family protein [Candidatus Ozemobacteraceae bacterium]